MKHYKYIIIGQGLAGSMLSMRMQEMGIEHLVVDQPSLSASSKIAAGLANPIVLKRLKWVKDAELFMPVLNKFYQNWERELNTNFWRPITLHHVFHDNEEVNHWMEKSAAPNFKNHLGQVFKNSYPTIKAPNGIGALKNVAWLDTLHFLTSYRKFLNQQKQFKEMNIEGQAETALAQENISAENIIYCTGHLLRGQYPQTQKFFTPTRGELMLLNDTEITTAWHKAIFALPLGHGLVKIGATYAHDKLEDFTSAQGRDFLLAKLKQFYTGPFNVASHHGGVRPNVIDRKPVLGQVAENNFTFNGMGSRAVLMAPYLSELMVNYLNGNQDIPQRWNINRFTSN